MKLTAPKINIKHDDKGNKIQIIIATAVLSILYLGSRLYALESLPVFIDEALHIWRARAIREGLIAAGLNEGKWLSMVLMSLSLSLPGSALWVTRLTYVGAGALTIAAIVLIGKELFRIRTGLLAAVFYLFMPYSLFYNRLALTDGIAAAFGAWICYFSIKTMRSRNGSFIVALATLLISSILIKYTNFLFILIPLVAILFLLPRSDWRTGLARVAPSLLACLIILIALYVVGSATHFLGERTNSSSSLISIEAVILPNILKLANWFWILLTAPLAILTAITMLWALFLRSRKVWFLLAIFLLFILPYIIFIKLWYPRYLMFSLIPLALLMAQQWAWFEKKMGLTNESYRQVHLVSTFALGFLLIWPLLYNIRLVYRPESTQLPEIVSWQFIHGWPSGYGSRELSAFLVAQADKASTEVYVLRPSDWSHTNFGGLEVHLPADPDLELVDIGRDIPSDLELISKRLEHGSQILFIIDTTHRESVALLNTIQPQIEMERIWHYPKPAITDGLEVWKVKRILANVD